MSKYVFLYIDSGEDHPHPTAEQEKVYGDIFQWFTDNRAKLSDGGEELQPTRAATTVRKQGGGKTTVLDGPFVESKESIGGFSIVDVPDLQAAIALAKTWPGYGVEIRAVKEN